MNIKISPGALFGRVRPLIASKSQAHRAMLCAALADRPTRLACNSASKDVLATAGCVRALGGGADFSGNALCVTPIAEDARGNILNRPLLDCMESGSTLRFLLPLANALGRRCAFTGQGLLKERPLSPLYEQLIAHGARLSKTGEFPLECEGQLKPGVFEIAGNVSSQFVSGLLMALPRLSGDSELRVIGKLESAPYVEMTISMLQTFGVQIDRTARGFFVRGHQAFLSPGTLLIEGDWSNGAFFLAAGALGGSVSCEPLAIDSAQGDKAIAEILARFGAAIDCDGLSVSARGAKLRGITLDAADTPDLVPILAVVSGLALGDTTISGVRRLRLKESDRIASILSMMRALGVFAEESDGVLTIRGQGALSGGTVDAFNDHRIVMAAAVAGSVARAPVTILGAEACKKSYPGFFEQFAALGGRAKEV